MNVLIINTNQSVFPMPVMPTGAYMVAESAERAGHKVGVLDLMLERGPARAIALALRKSNPDVIGLSVRNIDNNDMREPTSYIPGLKCDMRHQSNATFLLHATVLRSKSISSYGTGCTLSLYIYL